MCTNDVYMFWDVCDILGSPISRMQPSNVGNTSNVSDVTQCGSHNSNNFNWYIIDMTYFGACRDRFSLDNELYFD